MQIKILVTTIDNINEYDVVILGRKDKIFDEVITSLCTMHNHFPKLNICNVVFDNNDELIQLLSQCFIAKKMVFFLNSYRKDLNYISSSDIETISILSNDIDLDLFSLKNKNYLGFQRQKIAFDKIKKIELESKFAASLGVIKSDVDQIEPELRNETSLYINLDFCKKTFVPATISALPTGFDPETLIELVRFTANSDNIKLIIFETENIDKSKESTSESIIISETIWYFLEGFEEGPYDVKDEDERVYSTLAEVDIDVEFIYSADADVYWVKLIDSDNIIACTSEDYEEGIKGHLTNRLMQKFSKF